MIKQLLVGVGGLVLGLEHSSRTQSRLGQTALGLAQMHFVGAAPPLWREPGPVGWGLSQIGRWCPA